MNPRHAEIETPLATWEASTTARGVREYRTPAGELVALMPARDLTEDQVERLDARVLAMLLRQAGKDGN